MKVFSTYLVAASLLVSQSGFTKNKTVKPVDEPAPIAASPVPDLPLNDDTYYNKFIGDIKKSPRTVALATNDIPALEASFAQDFKTMRDELVGNGIKGDKNEKGVADMNQLDIIINKYSEKAQYDKLSNQAKFLALQLRALKPFKGFIFRAKLYIAGVSATRTMIVTALRAQIAGIQSFFPVTGAGNVNHWEVVFKYLTENVNGIGSEILTDEDLYKFFNQLSKDNVPLLNDFAALFMTKDSKPKDGFTPIWWDNKLYMSFATFSGRDRYMAMGLPEMFAIYSAMSGAQSGLLSTTAYSFQGLQSSVKRIGKLFGIDNPVEAAMAVVDGKGAQGMSSYSRVGVLNGHKTLFAKTPECADKMKMAYGYLVSAIRSARASYELTKRLPEGADNLFDPRIVNGFGRIGDLAFMNADNLVNPNAESDKKDFAPSAIVMGEKVKITLKNFYDNPPEHLGELYPVNWDLTSKGTVVNVPGYTARGQNLRNYKYGMATEWNLKPYKKLFPDIQGNESTNKTRDLPRYARILAQTWGSSVFAIPLGAAIF